jgi:shikimate kinase
MDNIFLTGFMATGKTVVGQALARRLGRPFVDLDSEIERAAGLSVAEVFSRFGEGEFRSREREAIERVSRSTAAVVATGGGAVVDPRSRAVMRAAGKIVCLTADAEAILARLGPGTDRPLLADPAGRERKIKSLLAERDAAYADHDFTIDTSGRSPAEVVEAIAAWLAEPKAGVG